MLKHAVLGASLTVCGLALGACSSNHYVQRGADLYSEGRYVEADEVFERSEPRVVRAPLDQRAAYAVYRGATFVALGDLPHAQRWLSLASEIEHEQPGTLRPADRAFLDQTWRVLASRVSVAPAPATTAIASSSQVPSPAAGPAPAPAPRALTQ